MPEEELDEEQPEAEAEEGESQALQSQEQDGDGAQDDGEEGEFDAAAKEIASMKDEPAAQGTQDKSFLSRNQQALGQAEKKDPIRVIEAALFLSNKPLEYAELAMIAKTTVKRAKDLAEKLAAEYAERDGAVGMVCDAKQASMQLKGEFLAPVAELSKNVELTRKSTRMLALIAKKGKIMQSELRKYFRGDIYSYITELKELGYISSEKKGNTRLIKPTSKFFESFQLGATSDAPAAPEEPGQAEAQSEKATA